MIRAGLLAVLVMLSAAPAGAEQIRIALFNAALSRNGPGLLYADLLKEPLPDQVEAVLSVVAEVAPDVLILSEFDYDAGGVALDRFAALLAERGVMLDHAFAAPSNTGEPSGLDLDGDGETTGPRDAWGFGRFPGQYAMAVLSRHPIDMSASRTFRLMPWRALPDAIAPVHPDGTPFPSAGAAAAMRLSSKSHWDLSLDTPGGPLRLLVSHPTPPVFDGPEDLNGRRNHDEIAFWIRYLDGWMPQDDAGAVAPMPSGPFVLAGDLNADPEDGDGRREGIRALLSHPRVVDPLPRSAGGAAAAVAQGGANARHRGDPALDTADWRDDGAGPGNLRVDFILPDADLDVAGAGVYWPASGSPGAAAAAAASDHRLVWVDIVLPAP